MGQSLKRQGIADGTKHENRLIIFDWGKWRDRFKTGVTLKKKEIEDMLFIQGCSIEMAETGSKLKKRQTVFDLDGFVQAVRKKVPYGS